MLYALTLYYTRNHASIIRQGLDDIPRPPKEIYQHLTYRSTTELTQSVESQWDSYLGLSGLDKPAQAKQLGAKPSCTL